MSAMGVQRVLSRLMADNGYRRRFGPEFDACVAGFELTEDERAMLKNLNMAADDWKNQLEAVLPDAAAQYPDFGWDTGDTMPR